MSRTFGASSFIWASPFGDEFLSLFDRAKSFGYDTLEICIEDPALVTPQKVRDEAERTGLAVSVCGAFGPDRDVSHEDADRRKLGVDYLRTCIDIAEQVGSAHVIGPMYSTTGKTRLLPPDEREQQRRWAAESLREAADYAGERGIALGIEPLNRFETDLVNTVEQGLDLCDRIGQDNVGLLLDTFHMNIEEKRIGDALRSARGRITEVHACENDRGPAGSGHVPWDEVVAALDEIGYAGPIVVESFTPTIKEIARAVSTWRPVAESDDALARDALTYLKGRLGA